MEAWYQQCLDRNTELQGALEYQQHLQLQSSGHESSGAIVPKVANDENFPSDLNEATGTELGHPLPGKFTDSMVATGRDLLKGFRKSNGRQTVASPAKTAVRTQERRLQLTERLKAIEAPMPSIDNPHSESRINGRITKMLQASGRRLSLPGRWWNSISSSSTEATNSSTASSEDTESLTQHYCQAVEVSTRAFPNVLSPYTKLT